MPAPTVAALLDYEKNIEDALKTYLESAIASTQILTTRTLLSAEEIQETPRVAVSFQTTGTNPNQQAIRPSNSAQYDSHKQGTLTLIATVRRNASGQDLGTLTGQLREALLKESEAFDATTLPYYQVVTLREGSCVPSISADNDEITRTLTYAVEFYIKTDAWPS